LTGANTHNAVVNLLRLYLSIRYFLFFRVLDLDFY